MLPNELRMRSSEITLSETSHLLWVHGSVICELPELDVKPLDYERQPPTFGYLYLGGG